MKFNTYRIKLSGLKVELANHIRTATIDDIIRLKHIARKSFTETRQAPEVYADWIARSVYDKRHKVFVYDFKRVNGFIDMQDSILELIAVDPLDRSLGIGEKLFVRGICYSKCQDFDFMYVETEAENIPSNKLYQKFGGVIISQNDK